VTGLRFDVEVAIHIDTDTLTALVGPELAAIGREHLEQGRISELDADDGGASAVVEDPEQGALDVWVGVVDGELTGECDCAGSGGEPDAVCAHAVAVALGALEKGIAFSSISGRERVDAEQRWFAEVAGRLEHSELVGLVARQAAVDRRFAALLLSCAGELTEPGEPELAVGRDAIAAVAELAQEPDWDPHAALAAGQELLAELEVLAIRPATEQLSVLVGDAADTWDGVAEVLADMGEPYAGEAEEVADALAALSQRVAEECVGG
jgi:uncharacterized Zn finger protein